MTGKSSEHKNKGEQHPRGAPSSHSPGLNNAHASNGDKQEKELNTMQAEPAVEQHRSSRRPRQRTSHKSH